MRVLALGLCLAGAAALARAQEAASQPPVFAAQVESVFIDVFVESANLGAPRLTAQDFILRDNGVARAFELVPTDSLPTGPLSVLSAHSQGQSRAPGVEPFFSSLLGDDGEVGDARATGSV